MDESRHEDKYTHAHRERQRHIDAIVKARTDKKIVVAGPGTGKTYLFKTILKGKRNTLTLTFVNALVEDLSLELFGLSDVKTLHGFARRQLEKATGKSIKVFPKLSEVINEDAKILLDSKIDFDELFHNRADDDKRLEFYKARKAYYGHYGFSDLVFAAVKYFERHQDKIPVHAQVVVDEFQDFNTLEVSLIDLLAKKSPVLLTGDDDQALYESLKSASAKHIRQRHSDARSGYTSFSLPYCSRCTRVIVEATNDIISGAAHNGLMQGRIGKPFLYFEDADKDEESARNRHVVYTKLYAKQIPWFIQERVKEITKQMQSKFTVLILSPTRTQCRLVVDALKTKGFEHVQFMERKDSPEPTLLDGLKLLLEDEKCNLGWRVVAKTILDAAECQALVRETSKEGESRLVCEMIDDRRKRQVAHLLTTLRAVRGGKADIKEEKLAELLKEVGVDAYGMARDYLRDELIVNSLHRVDAGVRKTSILVTTIQSSKGLAADYVFITHFDDQYFVKSRDKRNISDQDVCNFLVALTRAKRKVFLLSTDTNKVPTFLKWIDRARIWEVEAPGASGK